MIEFIHEDITSLSIKEDAILQWLDNIIGLEDKILGDLCFVFCSDKYLLNINNKYLKHNFYTDVITFDYTQSNIISGDIFISADRIADNARKYKVTFNHELLRVIVHGVLHLLGFDDRNFDDKKIMTSKEDVYLKIFEDVE